MEEEFSYLCLKRVAQMVMNTFTSTPVYMSISVCESLCCTFSAYCFTLTLRVRGSMRYASDVNDSVLTFVIGPKTDLLVLRFPLHGTSKVHSEGFWFLQLLLLLALIFHLANHFAQTKTPHAYTLNPNHQPDQIDITCINY